jgi:hypothetical protein
MAASRQARELPLLQARLHGIDDLIAAAADFEGQFDHVWSLAEDVRLAVMMLTFHFADPLPEGLAYGGQHGSLEACAHGFRIDFLPVEFERDFNHIRPSIKVFRS